MKIFTIISFILVLLGGLNWTLVGLLDLNLFTTIVGDGMISMVLYLMVTISTVFVVLPRMMEFFHTS